MVPSKTPRKIDDSGKFCQNTLFFFNEILLSYQFPLVRPSCELGLPKCLPNASQMSPKCFPDASKMRLRWVSDASQIPDASKKPTKCFPNVSQMGPKYPKWWYDVMMIYDMMFPLPRFLFIDLSSMILQVGSEKPVWGLVLGSYIYIYGSFSFVGSHQNTTGTAPRARGT